MVYEALSTTRILTLERIRGLKVTQAAQTYDLPHHPIAQRVLRGLFKMIFQDGYFHGDLHPGNILIEPDGNVVLIDFGLVGRLTAAQRDHVLDVLIGMAQQDYQLVSRVFFELGIKLPGVKYDLAAFERDVVEVMEKHIANRTLVEVEVGAFFGDLVAGAVRHNIRMPPTYTMVFKALMTVEGIGKTVAPDLDFLAEAQPFVKEMLIQRYSPERLISQGVETLGSITRLMRVAPDAAVEVLQNLRQGRFAVQVEAEGLETLARAHQRAGYLQSCAITFAAFLVVGTLLEGRGPMVLHLHLLPLLALVGAGFFLVPLVRAVLRRS